MVGVGVIVKSLLIRPNDWNLLGISDLLGCSALTLLGMSVSATEGLRRISIRQQQHTRCKYCRFLLTISQAVQTLIAGSNRPTI